MFAGLSSFFVLCPLLPCLLSCRLARAHLTVGAGRFVHCNCQVEQRRVTWTCHALHVARHQHHQRPMGRGAALHMSCIATNGHAAWLHFIWLCLVHRFPTPPKRSTASACCRHAFHPQLNRRYHCHRQTRQIRHKAPSRKRTHHPLPMYNNTSTHHTKVKNFNAVFQMRQDAPSPEARRPSGALQGCSEV
jgi:hypothetical protein